MKNRKLNALSAVAWYFVEDQKKLITLDLTLLYCLLKLISKNECHRRSHICKIQRKTPIPRACNSLLTKRLWQRHFPVTFAEFQENLFCRTSANGCFWFNYHQFFHVGKHYPLSFYSKKKLVSGQKLSSHILLMTTESILCNETTISTIIIT